MKWPNLENCWKMPWRLRVNCRYCRPQHLRKPSADPAAGHREADKRAAQATDKVVTDIWTAPATLDYIRDYVARTLTKS